MLCGTAKKYIYIFFKKRDHWGKRGAVSRLLSMSFAGGRTHLEQRRQVLQALSPPTAPISKLYPELGLARGAYTACLRPSVPNPGDKGWAAVIPTVPPLCHVDARRCLT